MKYNKQQVKALHDTYQKINADIVKGEGVDSEIQKRMASELSNATKRAVFCAFMQYQFTVDKKVVARLQNCINKPATQRYHFKVAEGEPLTKVLSIRTADKGLVARKIATPAQLKQTGVYHSFTYPKPKAKKLTQLQKLQAVINEFSITKVQFEANADKLKFHVIA